MFLPLVIILAILCLLFGISIPWFWIFAICALPFAFVALILIAYIFLVIIALFLEK